MSTSATLTQEQKDEKKQDVEGIRTREGEGLITLEELLQHSTPEDCWIAVDGVVYVVDSETQQEHPGGALTITRVAGTDCTADFNDIGHSDFAWEWLRSLKKVGVLDGFPGDVDQKIQNECGGIKEAAARLYEGVCGWGVLVLQQSSSWMHTVGDVLLLAILLECFAQFYVGKWDGVTVMCFLLAVIVGVYFPGYLSKIFLRLPFSSSSLEEEAVSSSNINTVTASTTNSGRKRASSDDEDLRVARIFVYPIKACGGVEVDSAEVTAHGFKGDREYVLVKEDANAKSYYDLLKPYDLGALALIHPSMPSEKGMTIQLAFDGVAKGKEEKFWQKMEVEGSSFATSINKKDNSNQDVDTASRRSIFVPRVEAQILPDGESNKKSILMYDKCLIDGIDQGDEAADFITNFLKAVHEPEHSTTDTVVPRVRLLWVASRQIANAKNHPAEYFHPRAANYTPFMYVTEETLRYVNQGLREEHGLTEPLHVTTRRFRPNIVFRRADTNSRDQDDTIASGAFSEDSWRSLTAGTQSGRIKSQPESRLQLDTVKSCGRCSHIFVNPITGECDADCLQKLLRNMERDGKGMIKKLESKFQREGATDASMLVDPVLPHFRAHYQKFVDEGRVGKVFLGCCAKVTTSAPHETHVEQSASNTIDERWTTSIGQSWTANISRSRVSDFPREMQRDRFDNRETLYHTQNLACAFGNELATKWSRSRTSSDVDDLVPVPVFLNPEKRNERKVGKITEIVSLTHNTKRIRISYNFDDQQRHPFLASGLPCGQHISLFCDNAAYQKEKWNNKLQSVAEKQPLEIKRSFTPVACGNGYFDLVVKIYHGSGSGCGSSITIEMQEIGSSSSSHFPDGGRLTHHYLDKLHVGDCLQFAGPFGHIEYLGCGEFATGSSSANDRKADSNKSQKFSRVVMVAGGTGITPMLQILNYMCAEKKYLRLDEDGRGTRVLPTVELIYANRSEEDILCRNMVEACVEEGVLQKLVHVLSSKASASSTTISANAEVVRGQHVNSDLLQKHVGSVADEEEDGDRALVLLCGPLGLVDSARSCFSEMGYSWIDEF
ncbi:unnamed protein product [Amoebophrya sp. A25]|nr:unnamed protein product [Amoebophrya sp. A25]|eukprot:GSA25T00020764001.1